MGGDILIISAPTLDLIGKRRRAGGPGLYGGIAAKLMGYKPAVLGPSGWDDTLALKAYLSAGIDYVGPVLPGCAYRFKHEYTSEGRLSRITCRASALGSEALHDMSLSGHGPVVASPVGCELSPSLIGYLGNNLGLTALDAQGIVRCYPETWLGMLGSSPLASLIHLSNDDTPELPLLRGVLAYTTGADGGYVLVDGKIHSRIPSAERPLDDPTGAGDVFTVIAAIISWETGDPVEAAHKAGELVPETMREVRAVVDSILDS